MSRRRVALAAAAAALVVAGGVLLRPPVPQLSSEATGDARIAQFLREDSGGGAHDQLVAAVVTPDDIRYAGLGADENTEVEIGSVTKTMTALLLTQSVASGTVSLDDRAVEHAPELDGFDGTLEELATHRSGLPRLPAELPFAARSLIAQLRGEDPYTGNTAEDVLRHAAEAEIGERDVSYSNLGAAVLGQTLARAEGADYADLLRERILEPLGMDASTLPETADALDPGAPTGSAESGRAVDAWTMAGYAPAGGIRSTASDMARYAQALLTADPALGVDPAEVLDPRYDAGESRIGLAWFTSPDEGSGPTTWHNGGTAGYSTMLAIDRERGIAVFLNGNTASSVDDLALRLLTRIVEEEA